MMRPVRRTGAPASAGIRWCAARPGSWLDTRWGCDGDAPTGVADPRPRRGRLFWLERLVHVERELGLHVEWELGLRRGHGRGRHIQLTPDNAGGASSAHPRVPR